MCLVFVSLLSLTPEFLFYCTAKAMELSTATSYYNTFIEIDGLYKLI